MLLLLQSLLPCWALSAATAKPYGVRLAVGAEGHFSDNIFFTPDDAENDFYTLIRPQLEAFRLTERTLLRLTGRADLSYYETYSGLNAADYNLDGSFRRQWTERLESSLEAGYTEDQRRERELTETGLLFTDDRRQRQRYGFSGRYLLNEWTTAGFGYQYFNETYDTDKLFDTQGHQVEISLLRALDHMLPRATARLRLGAGLYDYSRAETQLVWVAPWEAIVASADYRQQLENYSATAGLGYAWTETVVFNLDLGGSWTRSDSTVTQHIGASMFSGPEVRRWQEHTETFGFMGSLEMNVTGEKHRINVSASHDMVPASGRSALTERTALSLVLTRRLNAEWRLDGAARYFRNRSGSGGPSRPLDEDSVQLEMGVRRHFDPHWSIGARYRLVRIDDRQLGLDRMENSVVVSVNWQWSTGE